LSKSEKSQKSASANPVSSSVFPPCICSLLPYCSSTSRSSHVLISTRSTMSLAISSADWTSCETLRSVHTSLLSLLCFLRYIEAIRPITSNKSPPLTQSSHLMCSSSPRTKTTARRPRCASSLRLSFRTRSQSTTPLSLLPVPPQLSRAVQQPREEALQPTIAVEVIAVVAVWRTHVVLSRSLA
jgi:hypothetical protein